MIATLVLLYSVRLYRSGDTPEIIHSAERAEKIGTWLGVIAFAALMVGWIVYGYHDCVLDASTAQVNAISALGCNSPVAQSMEVSNLCVTAALDSVAEVTYAASAKSWCITVMIGALIL